MSEPGVRDEYDRLGVDGYYRAHAADYRNPHEDAVAEAIRRAAAGLDLSHVLDLACGSGEATLVLRALGAARVDGMDPYTGPAYRDRTGQDAEAIAFADIAAGALGERRWSLIVCSYAMHLVEESRLPVLALRLAEVAPALLIVTPHKRPDLRWGWTLAREDRWDRVRTRLYTVS